MKRKVVVYVAGPISKGDLMANVAQAHRAGIALLKAGMAAIVPHGSCFWGNLADRSSFTPQVLPADTTHEDWYDMDLAILERCDCLLRLPGESAGADREVEHAFAGEMPVFYSLEDLFCWFSGRED